MRDGVRTLGIASVVCLLGGCGGSEQIFCPDVLTTSLMVSIFDASTGAPAATGATVIVHGAAFQDSVVLTREVPPPQAPYMVFEDRAGAGTYTVIVRKPGYQDWQQTNVVIRAGRCGVDSPAQVTARLQH